MMANNFGDLPFHIGDSATPTAPSSGVTLYSNHGFLSFINSSTNGAIITSIPIVGAATMTGGTITITNTAVTTASNVVASSSNDTGALVVTSVNNGNFVLTSTDSTTCQIFYIIQN